MWYEAAFSDSYKLHNYTASILKLIIIFLIKNILGQADSYGWSKVKKILLPYFISSVCNL